MDENSIWTANNLVTGPAMDGGKVRIPDLQTKDASGHPKVIRDNAEKGELLYKTFFPLPSGDDTEVIDPDYPPPAFKFEEVLDDDGTSLGTMHIIMVYPHQHLFHI